MKTLSLVVPVYNEEKTITKILQKIRDFDSLGLDKEIVIINDSSKDSSDKLIKEFISQNSTSLKIIYENNIVNLGKSQSVKKGIILSTGDLVVIQDADLEYDPSDLTSFIYEFNRSNDLLLIYGNRFGRKNKVIYLQNWIGNRILTLISNLFTFRYKFWVNDMEVCYKMAKGEIYRRIAETISSKTSFGFEPEVTAKFAKLGKNYQNFYMELPISYYPRTIAEGKHMVAFRDGLKALYEIIKFNLMS